MNVSLHTAAPHIQFGNKCRPVADIKFDRVGKFINQHQAHWLQAEMRQATNPVTEHVRPTNIGFDGVVREKSGAVYGGPSIRPSRPQITAEEGTAPALAPFDA